MHHERLLMHHKRLLMHEEPTLSALGVKLRAHDSMLHAARREIRQVNLVEAVAELASEGLLRFFTTDLTVPGWGQRQCNQ